VRGIQSDLGVSGMAVSVGHRYRFRVDQYHRMGTLGIFQPDCRVELLAGRRFGKSGS
jgi:hypothetical protein